MSQQKAQLISPIDTFTPPGINVTGAGIVTATSFVGSGGTVTGLTAGANVNVGVVTATSFYGDGSNLDGVAAAGYVGQTTAAQSGTTTIDLSAGNVIYFTQDTDTTVAFASTEAVQEVLFIRTKDDTTDARTITWPESIIWNGGTAPTLIDSSDGNDVQIFNLTTRDQGVTWYGYEAMKNDPVQSGTLFSFGVNGAGQLAQNDTVTRSSPTQVPGTQWTSVTSLLVGTLAVKSDKTMWSWGYNNYGQLGQNNTVSYSSPVQLQGSQWSADTNKIASDSNSVSVIKTDGTLWAWGENTYGQLGQNDAVPRSSPVQLPGSQWDNVLGTNGYRMMVTKTDGTLWVWGHNNQGKLGLNDTVNRSSPKQIPGTQWSKIGSGYNHGIAIKTDGTLWIWGQHLYAQLGLNDQVDRSSPIQIPGTQWTDVGRARYSSYAFKTGNELWAWGYNGGGELGQNNIIYYSSPIQIPGTQWDKLPDAGMGYNAVMTKSDDTLWAMGRNADGQLGLNDTANRSSPTQIPGTGWVDFGSTYRSGHYIRTL